MRLKTILFSLLCVFFYHSCYVHSPPFVIEGYVNKETFELFVKQTNRELERLQREIESDREKYIELKEDVSILKGRLEGIEKYVYSITNNFDSNRLPEVKIPKEKEKIIQKEKKSLEGKIDSMNEKFQALKKGLPSNGYNGDLVPEKSLLTVPLKTELIVPLCILRTG